MQWTRLNDQSEMIILYIIKHIAKEITLILYGQTSNDRRFDSGDRCCPFFGLQPSEHT